jgi:Mrr N-terminal domain
MKSAEFDDEVWAELQKRAEPLVDSVNDVMRRVLSLPRKPSLQVLAPQVLTPNAAHRPRQGRVNGTPEIAFRIPILKVLAELGGRGRRAQVLDRVGEMMRGALKPIDYDLLESGADIRWRINASYQRKHMIDSGLLNASSPHGIWETTEAGREYLARAEREGRSA